MEKEDVDGDQLSTRDDEDKWAFGGHGHHLASGDGERGQLAHGNHLQAGSDVHHLADGVNSNQLTPDCDGNCLEVSGDGTQAAHGGDAGDLDGGGTQLAPSGDYSQPGTSGDGFHFDQPTFCHPVVARFRHADVVVWPSYFNLECVHFHHDL